jgi:hypothetical protein
MEIFFFFAMWLLGLIRTIIFSFFTVEYIILLWLDLNWSMNLSLKHFYLNQYKGGLQPVVTWEFFKLWNTTIQTCWEITCADTAYQDLFLWLCFLISVSSCDKSCPSVLETISIRVPALKIRHSTMFSCSFSKCPFSEMFSAANAFSKSRDFLENRV